MKTLILEVLTGPNGTIIKRVERLLERNHIYVTDGVDCKAAFEVNEHEVDELKKILRKRNFTYAIVNRKVKPGKVPLTIASLTQCDICGKELTSAESIERHRGQRCHTVWLEKRLTELELQMDLARAAIAILLKDRS